MPAADKPDMFHQLDMPIWCEECNQQGYIFDENVLDESFFVVCPHCGWETSSVSCPKCEIGGPLITNLADRPDSWACPDCKTVYPLKTDFYHKPKTLYLQNDLPEDVQLRAYQTGVSGSELLYIAWVIMEIVLLPAAIGTAVAALLYPGIMDLAWTISLCGMFTPMILRAEGTRLRDRILLACLFLAWPAMLALVELNRPPEFAAIVVSYVLGILYATFLLPVLLSHAPKR